MKIQQIRNATIFLKYLDEQGEEVNYLIDPWLAPKGGFGTFAEYPQFKVMHPEQEKIPMPIHDLPMSVEEILDETTFSVLTHVHPDHIDIAADGTLGKYLDKELPIIAPTEEIALKLRADGFKDIYLMSDEFFRYGRSPVELMPTPARHGTLSPCGEACGLLFKAPNEKLTYLAGDTVWFEGVKRTLETYRPEIVIVNACAAELEGYGRLIMDDEDIARVHETLPEAELVITHMDNVAHASIDREQMRKRLSKRGIEHYHMPEDGETLDF